MVAKNLKKGGILQMLAQIGCTVEIWAGGFKFSLTRINGATRTFSFQVAEHQWVELTPTGAVQVADRVVADAAAAVIND